MTRLFPVALAAVALCSCSTTFEATLEVSTSAIETLTSDGGTTLHPGGDTITVPAGVTRASVSVDAADPVEVNPGSTVELVVIENEPPGRVTSRVVVDGREIHRAAARLEVKVGWAVIETRLLPPKVERIEIELDRGEAKDVDVRVMYTPMPGSKLEQVKTEAKLVGPDAEAMKWVPSSEPSDGRVTGRVEAPRKD